MKSHTELLSPTSPTFGGTVTIAGALALTAMGLVTLSGGAGTAIVYTTKLTTNSRIFLTHQNASGTLGTARVTASSAAVSFTIATGGADTSVIAWHILEQG